jgi:hypothetical protein
MVETLRSEWHNGMSFEATIELRDGLDAMLQRIRSEQHIRTPVFNVRIVNVRIVGMLVKAGSPMSAFVQCSCHSCDSASPMPSRSRRSKRVGHYTRSRTDSTFLAMVRGFNLPRCLAAVIHQYKATVRQSRLQKVKDRCLTDSPLRPRSV